jgi:acyl-CoA synthetase (AMP-forming)/AMP-acid ligase II
LDEVSIRILDGGGCEMKAGEAGEIVLRGPNVSPGYLNRPEENAAAFRDGWFYTGDMGQVDENGYLYLLDRKKDMIITGDENVFSSDVEAVLYQHPNVHEAAVIGIPDERYGEALMAVIVPVPGTTISEEAMIAHCRGKIGGYKIPRRFAFLDEMPKSALGKILKTELRRVYASGTEEVK